MSLTIRDVLHLPRLQALRLRAGAAGEHRAVRWPYVAENESISEWVLGGELVFVTGINLPRSEANLRQLVREVHQRRCAGLVVLTGPRYIQHIPASVLAEADRLDVPLIEQPYELPMIVVTEAIGSALVQAQMLGTSRQQLIGQLLEGNPADVGVLTHRAASLALDLSLSRQIVVLQISGTAELFASMAPSAAEALLQATRHHVLQHASHCAQALPAPWPVLTLAEQWVLLLPVEAPAEGPQRNRTLVTQLLQTLREAPSPLRVFAGLSAPCPQPADLARGLGQAREALRAAQSFPERLGLCCFDELGVLELLVAIRDRALLDRFVHATLGALLQYDTTHQAMLTPTLEAWIQCNGNLAQTAQRLGIHRNTLSYRLQQIHALSRLDLEDAQHRLSAAMALMIQRLSPHPPTRATP